MDDSPGWVAGFAVLDRRIDLFGGQVRFLTSDLCLLVPKPRCSRPIQSKPSHLSTLSPHAVSPRCITCHKLKSAKKLCRCTLCRPSTTPRTRPPQAKGRTAANRIGADQTGVNQAKSPPPPLPASPPTNRGWSHLRMVRCSCLPDKAANPDFRESLLLILASVPCPLAVSSHEASLNRAQLATFPRPWSANRSINSVAVELTSKTSGGNRLNKPAGCCESVTTRTNVAGCLLCPAL